VAGVGDHDGSNGNGNGEYSGDLISKVYQGFNRGRVNPVVMQEIGFEDCDFVSLEQDWTAWREVAHVWPMELHVPCRDPPLDHLLSQCNHREIEFDCGAPSLVAEVDRCLMMVEQRFDTALLDGTTIPNVVSVKCFDPIPPAPYLNYMSQFLQPKRIESTYVHRITNNPRDKSQECLWNNPEVAKRVLEILMTYDYYRWCAKCLGSENDLLASST